MRAAALAAFAFASFPLGCWYDWSTPAPPAVQDGGSGTGPNAYSCSGPVCAGTCGLGGCNYDCAAGQSCTGSCSGGGCHYTCRSGSTCNIDCSGGGCGVDCESGATCTISCSGGGCTCTGPGC